MMSSVEDDLVAKILDSVDLMEDDNLRWVGTQSVEYDRNVSLLLTILMNNNLQRELNVLRYYFSNENGIINGHELTAIVRGLKKENKRTFNDFNEKLSAELENIRSTPVQKFTLYYPINMKVDEKINEIKFRDIKIESFKFDEIKEILDSEELKKRMNFEKFTANKYHYLAVSVWGRNKEYAQSTATKYVSLLVGIISFIKSKWRASLTISGMPKPMAELWLNFIFVFKETVFDGYYYFYDKSNDRKIINLVKEEINEINEIFSRFNSADEKVQEVFFKSVDSYYSGLKEAQINYSFLNFWTGIEIISLKDRSMPHAGIIKILRSILVKANPIDDLKLDRLYSLRNNLVHAGDSKNITEHDRNLMKAYLEAMLEFFIFRLSTYNLGEMRAIYELLPKSSDTLKSNKVLIDFIIKLREDSQNATPNE